MPYFVANGQTVAEIWLFFRLFLGFWGQNRGSGGAILTHNELVLTFVSFTSVPLLAKIDQEMRPRDYG